MRSTEGGGAVHLNIYDIAKVSESAYGHALVRVNSITRGVGLGGVFHGGIEVYGVEWSYGYCEEGTGVRAREHLHDRSRRITKLPFETHENGGGRCFLDALSRRVQPWMEPIALRRARSESMNR